MSKGAQEDGVRGQTPAQTRVTVRSSALGAEQQEPLKGPSRQMMGSSLSFPKGRPGRCCSRDTQLLLTLGRWLPHSELRSPCP